MKKWFFLLLVPMFCFSTINLFADNAVVSDSSISSKIDKLVETQNKILSTLEEIKAELQVVKIRASQR